MLMKRVSHTLESERVGGYIIYIYIYEYHVKRDPEHMSRMCLFVSQYICRSVLLSVVCCCV